MADYKQKLERFAVPIVIKLYKIADRLGSRAVRFEERIPRKIKAVCLAVIVLFAIGLAVVYLQDKNLAILSPRGYVAVQQKRLIVTAALMSLIIVVPVFVMTVYIAYTYRSSNKKAVYRPDFDHSNKIEAIWWGVPMVLIFILSIITWQTSHSLDPYKPIESAKRPLVVQVVALNWKWLFIYPQENVATVNNLTLPMNRPIEFRITSDATMNSFWIPQLGSQVYAMNGMSTEMHLLANKEGLYNGASANISGKGFAGMHFPVHVVSADDFTQWVNAIPPMKAALDKPAYDKLSKPTENVPPLYFTLADTNLFNEVLAKYMPPGTYVPAANQPTTTNVMDHMHMGAH